MDRGMMSAIECAVCGAGTLVCSAMLISGGSVALGSVFLFISAFGFMPIAFEMLGL